MALPRVADLSDAERAWLKARLELAQKIVAELSPEDASAPTTLAALDRTWAAWLEESTDDLSVINEVVNAIGVAFGQLLVEGLGLRWVIATDDHGTDLAVHGLPGAGDVLVFPANFVAKRYERRETRFLEEAYVRIAKSIEAFVGPRARRS